MHFALTYQVSDDYLSRRPQYRDEHLTLAWAAQERGELILAGAFDDPADGALLIFAGESADVARQFAESDPYVRHGLVRSWHIRPWNTVVGDLASNPVYPQR